jgi:hypothetical protein
MPPRHFLATVVSIVLMRDLSSNSHRIPTRRRIMVVMGIAVKLAVGLVLLLPMTAYVVGSLVAAADEPREHAPIILEEPTRTPEKPTDKSTDHRPDDHKSQRGGDDHEPQVIPPSPDVLDDDGDVFDDHGGNSGPGGGGDDSGGDDSSGKGSGDD